MIHTLQYFTIEQALADVLKTEGVTITVNEAGLRSRLRIGAPLQCLKLWSKFKAEHGINTSKLQYVVEINDLVSAYLNKVLIPLIDTPLNFETGHSHLFVGKFDDPSPFTVLQSGHLGWGVTFLGYDLAFIVNDRMEVSKMYNREEEVEHAIRLNRAAGSH